MSKIPRGWTVFEQVDGWTRCECDVCARQFWRHPSHAAIAERRRQRYAYCSRQCLALGHKKHPPNWKGGRFKCRDGYINIWAPDHPHTKTNQYILEHRLIVEENIGRYLGKDELVHHINGIRDDNRIENLIILTRKNHLGMVLCPHCGKSFAIK